MATSANAQSEEAGELFPAIFLWNMIPCYLLVSHQILLSAGKDEMRNRNKDEIDRDVLAICGDGGAILTKIMFKAYLSHAQAKVYIGELIEKGLIEILNFREYRTTSMGLEYLVALKRLTEILAIETRRAFVSNGEENHRTVDRSSLTTIASVCIACMVFAGIALDPWHCCRSLLLIAMKH